VISTDELHPPKSEPAPTLGSDDAVKLPVCHEALSVSGECGREQCRASCRTVRWVRRFGVAGFVFFLVKGLLWLIVPVLVARGLWNS
jgi:hypothetical protein